MNKPFQKAVVFLLAFLIVFNVNSAAFSLALAAGHIQPPQEQRADNVLDSTPSPEPTESSVATEAPLPSPTIEPAETPTDTPAPTATPENLPDPANEPDSTPTPSVSTNPDEAESTLLNVITDAEDDNIANIAGKEDIEKRSLYSKSYNLDNGQNEVILFGLPVHYLDNGELRDIDNSLELTGDKTGCQYYQNKANAYQVKVAADSNSDWNIWISQDKYSVKWKLLGDKKDILAKSNTLLSRTQWQHLKEGEKRHYLPNLTSQVTYKGAMDNIDIQYNILSNKIEENAILYEYNGLTDFSERFSLSNLDLDINEDKSIDFTDPENDSIIFSMPPPYMIDSKGDVSEHIEIKVTKQDDDYILTYLLDDTWLKNAHYPVIIDPQVNVTNTDANLQDTRLCQQRTTTNYASSYAMVTGYNTTNLINYGLVKLVSLPSLSTYGITNVNQIYSASYRAEMNLEDCPTGTTTVGVHKVTSSWNVSTVTWNTRPSFVAAPYSTQSVNQTLWADYTWNITHIMRDWYTTNYGLLLANDASPMGPMRYFVTEDAAYGNPSAAWFLYDTTAPTAPSVSTSPQASASWTKSTSLTVSWIGITDAGGSGLGHAEYKVDSGTWTAIPTSYGIASGSYAITISGSATHTISVRGVDNSNNANDAGTGSVVYKLDVNPPVPSFTNVSVTDGPLNSGDPQSITGDTARINYSYSGTDNLSGIASYEIQMSTNGAAYTAIGASPLLNQYDNSSYRLRIRACDNAGNMSGWVESSIVYSADRRPPRRPFPVSVSPSGWTKNTLATYTYDNATDYENHLRGVEYKIVNQSSQVVLDWPSSIPATNFIASTQASGTFTVQFSSYPDGEYTVYARSRDEAGNTSNAETGQVFRKDTTGITLALAAPAQNEIITPLVDIRGSFNDSRLSFWRLEYGLGENPSSYSLITVGHNNFPAASVLYTWSTFALTEGQTYTLRLYAEDTCGNTSEVKRLVTKGVNPPLIDAALQVDAPQLFAETANQPFTYQRADNGGADGLTGVLYINGEQKGSEATPGNITANMTGYMEGNTYKFFIESTDQIGNKLYSCKTQDVIALSDSFNSGDNEFAFSNTTINSGALKLANNGSIYSSTGSFITNEISTSTETLELKIVTVENKPAGTSISYQYSIDNGTSWTNLPAAGVKLNGVSHVKIKGTLTTTDTSVTPSIDSLSILTKYFIQQNSLTIALVDNPENLSTLPNVNHTIKLRWDASSTPGATYCIYRANQGGSYTQIASGITTKYWYDYNLNYSQTFNYKVTAMASISGTQRESVPSNVQWATVVDSDEVSKAIGKKGYWTFADFETGSGEGNVNVASGNLYYQTTDFAHTSPGVSMNMVRNYNSHATYKTCLGYGWDFSFNVNLLQEYNANHEEIGMLLKMGDGTIYRFEMNTDGTYKQPDDSYISLTKDAATNKYTVTFKGGTEYLFSQYMQLESIDDRNGNALHLEYDPNRGNLTRVYNDVGDEIVFTYTYVSSESQEADRLDTASDTDVARRIYHYNYNNETHKLEGAYIYLDEANTDKYGEQYIYWPVTDLTRANLLQTVNNPGGYGTDFDYVNGKIITVADAKQQYMDFTYNTGETVKTYLNATARYQYDNKNRITKLTNSIGHETNYTYDDKENESDTQYSKNNIKTISYLNKVGAQDNVNVVTSFTYDTATGNKLTCTTPDGYTTYYTDEQHPYNEFGLPTITKTPFRLNGGTVEYAIEYFEYDAHGNLTREAGPIVGNETLYTEHDQFGNIETKVTKIDGQVFSTVHYDYDQKGRLVQTEYPYDTVVKEHFDAEGNVDWEEDAMGIRTTHTYDIIGRMKTTTKPGLDGLLGTADDVTDKLDYDKNDNVVAFKEGTTASNPNGSVTQMTYDSLGRVETVTDPTNKEKSAEYSNYDAYGNTIVTNKEGEKQSLKNTYDKAGRISETIYGGITAVNTEYDNLGRVLSSTDSAGGVTETEYDIMGRVVKTTNDPGDSSHLNIINRLEYDLMGNVTKTIDGKSIESVTVYDMDGRPLSESKTDTTVTPSKTITITYNYDNVDTANGTVKTVVTTQPSAGQTRVQEMYYDRKGNLFKEINKGDPGDNLETSITYEYDKNNSNTKKTVVKSDDPTLYITDFLYDKLDRLIKTTFATDFYIEYTYDSRDNMLSMTQTKGAETTVNSWTYDAADRMLEVKLNNQTVVAYEYTTEGYLKYMKYPQTGGGERKIEYKYDDNVRLYEIADSSGQTSLKIREYLYDEDSGLLEKLNDYRKFGLATPDYTQYTEQSFGYDSIGRMSGVCYSDIASGTETIKEQYVLLFDNNSNIVSETVDTYYTDHLQVNKEYGYDGFNRMLSEDSETVLDDGTPEVIAQSSTSYEYDNLCNRTRMTSGTNVYDYTYNQLNQLTETKLNNVTDTTFTYDSRGNQLTRAKGDTLTTYVYDIADRMTQTKQQIGQNPETVLAQYKYDGSGQRLSQTAGSNTTRYYYDGTDLLYTDNGTTQRLEENIMEPDGSIFATKRFTGSYAGNHYFYRQDIRGSVSNIVGDGGNVVKSYAYDAYGNTTLAGDANFENCIAYTGAVYDSATGLYYLNARYYDSATGRFISVDSYRGEPNNPWTWNEYGYCDGNPVVRGDKSGHFFNLIAGAIGAAVGAVVGAAVTLATDLIEDGKINKPATEYLGAAASGAVAGLAAGVTCGASLVVTAAVIGTASAAGSVIGQGISKGFSKIDYGQALFDGGLGALTFGASKALGPVIKTFGAKVASKIASSAKPILNKVTTVAKNAWNSVMGRNKGSIPSSNVQYHGNSKLSMKPQHGYEIYNKSSGDVVKTGISGKPLNKCGSSPRANVQVNRFNMMNGSDIYGARVVAKNIPGRSAALAWERGNADRLRALGNSMSMHFRP